MAIHDWTKVEPSTFHHFHSLWISEISNALNAGMLPPSYYAMAEQHAGNAIADVLTLECASPENESGTKQGAQESGAVALLEAPPKVALTEKPGGLTWYANQRRTIAIRRANGDKMVAMIEILSPGNKSSREKLQESVHKAFEAVERGIHLLVVDLIPPGSFDQHGIHGELRREFGLEKEDGEWPIAGKPLTLGAYDASKPAAYVQPVSVGDTLIEMPLFLQPGRYINVPLEQTYVAAYKGVPQRWKSVIEG